jgi:dTDP-4-amino-4,6-dideoxygalactose transaminase
MTNKDVLFIEDSAPSLVQDEAGIYGDVSIFSFSPTKPFCSGEGSVIVTDDRELHDALKEFRYIGQYNNLNTSLNFAISSLLAAYLIPQFDFIDEIKEMREKVHNEYKKHLNIFEEKSNRHGAIMYLSDKAEKISKRLTQFDIEHRYKYYPNFINTPNACKVREQIIDLPMHHELTSDHIKFISEIVKRAEI